MAAKTDEIYLQILDQLADGSLKVGKRVSEQSLAEQLGVSRTPVREAIKRLQGDGYLDQVHRYGTVVREPSLQEIAEAYDLREALETYVVERTPVERFGEIDDELIATCEDLEALACEFAGDLSGDRRALAVKRFFDLDAHFHEAFVRCNGNKRFASLIEHARLFARIHGVRRHSVVTFETVMGVCRDHTEILKGVRSGDCKAASDALRRHIRASKSGALDWLRLQHRIAGFAR